MSINYKVKLNVADGTLIGGLSSVVSENTTIKSIASFKGVPYANPPVGSRRWKPAEPTSPWLGEKLALSFAPACPQPVIQDKSAFFYYPGMQISEDCLYLNVWSPAGNRCREEISDLSMLDEKLPVMVWIHGGGLVVGAGSQSFYNPEELVKKGVVVVTINYRLGVFGYFSHPELTVESPHKSSGNYGITDQIQALRWVRDNISAFGGDSGNITIFGESAGALSVSHLMASPVAKGLFDKAIIQSAYLPAIPALNKSCYGLPSAESAGLRLSETLATKSHQKSLQALRELPATELLKLAQRTMDNLSLAEIDCLDFDKAVIDGWILKEQIFETFEQGKQHPVPLLGGFNSFEGSYFSKIGLSPKGLNRQSYQQAIRIRYGEIANEYFEIYPAEALPTCLLKAIGDSHYGWGTARLTKAMAAVGTNSFLYYFDHPLEWAEQQGLGAFHMSELFFTFNNISRNLKPSPNWPDIIPRESDLSMAKILSDCWVAFATSGQPSTEYVKHWPDYSKENAYITFKEGAAHKSEWDLSKMLSLHEKIHQARRKNNYYWSYSNAGLIGY